MSKPTLDPKRRWLMLESSNIGAVRYYFGTTTLIGWLDVIFKNAHGEHHLNGRWTLECCDCRPKIFYRYEKVLVTEFVEMIFDESSGKFFNREIKARASAPEKLDLVWP